MYVTLAILFMISIASKISCLNFKRASNFLHRLPSPMTTTLLASIATSTAASLQDTCASLPAPVEYFRADYKPCSFVTTDIHLTFKLSNETTEVTATSTIILNSKSTDRSSDLVLDGEDLSLQYVKVNGNAVSPENYKVANNTLSISRVFLSSFFTKHQSSIELETSVHIRPDLNLALSGLYKTGSGLLCTQCEAMGFRRIAYHQDRPDILSRYKVYMEAPKDQFPLLLSNGNELSKGLKEGDASIHWATWEDPFPKPSYLFALVAGDLASIHDTYLTTSGRTVKLGIYSEKQHVSKLSHAMYSLKRSMAWDERVFGLECDLDVYNIVATDDFNMGAMENKGLNVFNSAYVLADPRTATDTDFERVLGVIGHEYFHNWSGNRVTVRDWFQLTLKEGLTVFRDQWFSSDETSRAVKRVEDVRGLRSRQFQEDQGPMAHPIRPESYISMDNFYTSTVYNKGAEVVRMYCTVLGEEGFKAGLKLYFERYDGQAVTCDDFRDAMADANRVDLSQFERWYSQAGTPVLSVSEEYDASSSKYTVRLKQHIPSTPGQPEEQKLPLFIPVTVGLLDRNTGAEILPSTVLHLKDASQSFEFENIASKPLLSILRDFSAPVKLEFERSDADLAFLMAYDTDSFNKWDAANQLSSTVVLNLAQLPQESIVETTVPRPYVEAVRTLLLASLEGACDLSLTAYALMIPDEATLMQAMQVIDIDRLHAARTRIKRGLADALKADFERVYSALSSDSEYTFNPQEVARRRLRNTCLDFLSSMESSEAVQRAKSQYDTANCMTDRLSALASLASQESASRDEALLHFHNFADNDPLMLNKWFAIQASSDLPNQLEIVKKLKSHPDFLINNPNRARSVLSVFAMNYPHFHAQDGEGYKFIADSVIELDALNPQVAARLASSFSQWKRFDEGRQSLMKLELERIRSAPGLSKDTLEIVTRCLK